MPQNTKKHCGMHPQCFYICIQNLTSPKLISSASSTFSINGSSKWVILSVNRDLSIVRTCSSRITESRSNPYRSASISTCVGNFAFWICAVIAATITVGLNRFPMSFWMTRTGLVPPCSEPTTGDRSAKKTSPRFIANFSSSAYETFHRMLGFEFRMQAFLCNS